jgi:IclR helix-turn-helix domain
MRASGFQRRRPSAEDRWLAAFEEGLARLSTTVDEAARRKRSWLERLRAGLVAFLAFFDDEPRWGRLLVSEAPLNDGVRAPRCEQRVLGVLTGLLDDGSPSAIAELMPEPQLTAELAAGGAVAAIRKRLLEDDERSFVELAPALMAFIVAPYLGEAAARAELTGRSAPAREQALPAGSGPRDVHLPIRLTRRTLRVLDAIATTPRASNREIARGAGLSDEGQTSKLLGRLQARGVLENVGVGAAGGQPNAWLLTAVGRRVLRATGGVPGGAPRAGSPGRPGGFAGEGRVA